MLQHAMPRDSQPLFRRRWTVAAAAALIAVSSVMVAAPRVHAATTLNVQVGVGDGPISGNAYLPGAVTVLVGDSIHFAIGSDEPHSVTFGQGPADVPPDQWPVTPWTAPAPVAGPPAPVDLGTASYDGSAFTNTGLMFGKTSGATLTFTKAGTFPFLCEIHPGMAGTVTVVDSGTATTQAEADAAAKATSDEILGQVDGVLAARAAAVTTTDNSDGSKTWNVFVDAGVAPAPLPGGGTGFLEVFKFVPDGLEIQPGDTVHWAAFGAHTVAIAPPGTDPATVDPFGPAAGGDTYDGASLYSSGLLNFGPGTPSEYSLKFPTAGVVPFFCALHAFLGQVGTLGVGMPVPSAAPATSAEPEPAESPEASAAG